MGTLKRFSYDNIVEHNPTAPDPVEGGGGSGGSVSESYFGGSYEAYLPLNIPAASDYRLVHCTINVSAASRLPSDVNLMGLLPVYNIYTLRVPEGLKDCYNGYYCNTHPDENGNLIVDIAASLMPHQNDITLHQGENSFILCQLVLVGIHVDEEP